MNDEALREAAARALGWEPFEFQGDTIWLDHEKQPRGVATPALNWTTAGALLESCAERGAYVEIITDARAVSRASRDDDAERDEVIVTRLLTARNVIEACVTALGSGES